MCSRYPNCDHAGPVHDEIAGIPRHCETVLPNHNCYYLRLGCRGCTFAYAPNPPVLGSLSAQLLTRLVAAGMVSDVWASNTADNVLLYTQRRIVYNRLVAYIGKRITAEYGNPESFFNDDQGA